MFGLKGIWDTPRSALSGESVSSKVPEGRHRAEQSMAMIPQTAARARFCFLACLARLSNLRLRIGAALHSTSMAAPCHKKEKSTSDGGMEDREDTPSDVL